jgi:hypothetical protein
MHAGGGGRGRILPRAPHLLSVPSVASSYRNMYVSISFRKVNQCSIQLCALILCQSQKRDPVCVLNSYILGLMFLPIWGLSLTMGHAVHPPKNTGTVVQAYTLHKISGLLPRNGRQHRAQNTITSLYQSNIKSSPVRIQAVWMHTGLKHNQKYYFIQRNFKVHTELSWSLGR